MKIPTLFLLVVLSTAPRFAVAQRATNDHDWRAIGRRVQIQTKSPGSAPLIGWIDMAADGMIQLAVAGRPDLIRLPIDSVQQVRVSIGEQNHGVAGVLIGAVLGAAIAQEVAPADAPRKPGLEGFMPDMSHELSVMAGAMAGMVIGVTVGKSMSREGWVTVRLNRH